MEADVASLCEQLNEKVQLNEAMKLELETCKRAAAASRAPTSVQRMLSTPHSLVFISVKALFHGTPRPNFFIRLAIIVDSQIMH